MKRRKNQNKVKVRATVCRTSNKVLDDLEAKMNLLRSRLDGLSPGEEHDSILRQLSILSSEHRQVVKWAFSIRGTNDGWYERRKKERA